MREIKFRGWHTGANRMFSAEEMAADQLTLLPTGSFINVNGHSTSLSTVYPNDKFIPLQYLGLNDRDGKEIYEGDIIEWDYEYDSDYDGDMPIVKRSTGRRAIEDILDRSEIYRAKQESKGCKVIGNIYEHIHLLK